MDEFRWTTGDGKSLLLSEMTTEHLRNAANFLRRTAKESENAYWSVGCMLIGEMATYYWESAQDGVTEEYNYKNSIADMMEAEIKGRMR